MASGWASRPRKKGDPCPICGKERYCKAYTDGGGHILCMFAARDGLTDAPNGGWTRVGKPGNAGGQRFAHDATPASDEAEPAFADDTLRLLFLCAHPAVPVDARVPLLDQVGHAVRDHARLAGPGAGEDQQRPVDVLDRRALFRVQ